MPILASATRVRTLALAALLCGTPSHFIPLTAQQNHEREHADSSRRSSTETLLEPRDAMLLAAFVGGTLALAPFDRSFAQRLQNPTTQADRDFANAASAFRFFGGPGPLLIGPALYIGGRLSHVPLIADLGLHGTEAVVVGGAVGFVIKGLAGRARPYTVADSNPRDFALGRGFVRGSPYSSFPSGHTTAAFAAAAAVTSEAARWRPRTAWVVGPLMYGGATLVGVSRMYHDQHWASDVVFGAAVGTFVGLKLVRYEHLHPENLVDRVLLPTTVGLDGHGNTTLAWDIPFR